MEVNQERLKSAIALIREKISIYDVVMMEHGTMSPGSKMIRCILHPDYLPSMSVNNEEGVYQCFSCGSHGNVISLIMDSQRELHKNLMNKEQTVEWILKENPEIAKELGFKSVFVKESESRKLVVTEDGEIVFGFKPRYKASLTPIHNHMSIARKMRIEQLNFNTMSVSEQDDFIERVKLLVSCCEVGIPIELTEEILESRIFDTDGAKMVTEISDEVFDAFSSII